MNSLELIGKKFTYYDWLNEYNDAMHYYNQDIYDEYFYIDSISIDIDNEPDIE